MGLFDFFKKNSNASRLFEDEQHSPLYFVVQKLQKCQDATVLAELSRILKEYIDNSKCMLVPYKPENNGYRNRIVFERGGMFVAIYSDDSEVQSSEDVMMLDINEVMTTVFHDSQVAGIIIDPNTTGLCLEKGFLLKCIFHGYLPQTHYPATPPKDWGIGIPEYTQSDLMSDGELLNFAIHTVLDCEEKRHDLSIISACDHLNALPNLILEYDGHLAFVIVKGYCAEATPALSNETLNLLRNYSKCFDATCYYAPVGFGSTDASRFDAWIALKGDGFYAKYTGLTKLF